MSTKRLRLSDVPEEVVAAFRDNPIEAPLRSIHVWEEHCTECAFPDCYKTCDLFEPRKDGNCRRFVDGAVPISELASGGEPVTLITFKRWANMYAVGPAKLLPGPDANRLARAAWFTSELFRRIPDGGLTVRGLHGPFGRMARLLRRRMADRILDTRPPGQPDAFVISVYVPGEIVFDATLTINGETADVTQAFQKRLVLEPGFHMVEIPFEEISSVIGGGLASYIGLVPNTEGRSASRIYLGYMGFVGGTSSHSAMQDPALTAEQPKPKVAKSIKVVVWDLDHTVWDGILVEDGPERVALKPGVLEVIKTLDDRGIINSISSKNSADAALATLERFGLAEFFVFPQINWSPKSQSVKKIIEDFNVGADTIAFIDDQPFERAEVVNALPDVRVYDAADYQRILEFPEFNPAVSSESSSRRLHYINEGARRALSAEYTHDDYAAFLRDCELKMKIFQGGRQDIDRIYELTQRTNQMNFSGTRYTLDDIVRMLADPSFDTFSLRCEDKFGDYGTVGFGLVALPQNVGEVPQVMDLAFSCRVQAKRAEHAFFAWLAESYSAQGLQEMRVRFVPTARNKAVAAVFDDMGFVNVDEGAEGLRIMSLATQNATVSSYPWTISHIDCRLEPLKDAI